MTVHSIFGASSRGQWSRCPGRNNLIAQVNPPASKNSASIWGDVAHDHCAQALNYIFNKGPMPAMISDPEMSQSVERHVETIAEDLAPCKRAGHRFKVFVESRVRVTSAAFGTADCITHCYDCRRGRVYDYKSGWHEVDVVENSQLLFYAAGAVLDLEGLPDDFELVIVQPRSAEPVKRWRVDTLRLVDEPLVIQAEIERAQAADAPLVPGDHCRWCPVSAVCPAQREANYEIAAKEFDKVSTESYDPAVLAQCLDAVDRIEAWISQVRSFAQNEANHGRVPPGYKIVQGRQGNRQWIDETSVLGAIAKFTTVQNMYEEPELKSPAEMEKLVPPAERKAVMEKLTTRPPGGRKLVKVSDPRPEVSCKPQDEFSAVPERPDDLI